MCFNTLSDKCKYTLIHSGHKIEGTTDSHLTPYEREVASKWDEKCGSQLNADEVVTLLLHNNKAPLWIDMTVYEAKKDTTVIELFCSRRLRDDAELYHKGEIMPFHLQVSMPPDLLKVEKGGKFDVNWKKRQDGRRNPQTMLGKINAFLFRLWLKIRLRFD